MMILPRIAGLVSPFLEVRGQRYIMYRHSGLVASVESSLCFFYMSTTFSYVLMLLSNVNHCSCGVKFLESELMK
jgi:hypothetical protein